MTWTDPRTWVAGEVVSATHMNAHVRDNLNMLRWQGVRKESDQSVTSSVTLISDTFLKLPIDASAIWAFEFVLGYSAHNSGDLKVAINVPVGATGHFGGAGAVAAAIGSSGDLEALAYTAFGDANTITYGGSTSGLDMQALVRGLVVNSTTAGDIQLRWAQAASFGTATIVRANSFAIGHRFTA
jgi:hypothetical protein